MPVVYDLSHPFPPDGTPSTITMRGSTGSMCPTLEDTVGLTGHGVICWGPVDNTGCRQMVVPYNSFCLDTADEPLGGACASVCANVSTHLIAIMDAGAAHYRVCAPKDASTSCRSTAAGGVELFRFQPGGWCVSEECQGASPDANTCVSSWGATYLGFGRRGTEKGWYDWASGAFRVDYQGHRPVCGALGNCIGNRGRWAATIVATPSANSPNPPPCLTKSGAVCNPATCTP
jgi:hypothetical protein